MLKKTRARKGNFVTALEPLFPGYIFVGCRLNGGETHVIGNTRGISTLVRIGDIAANVPRELIDELQRRCDQTGLLDSHTALTPGSQITMDVGPFTDFLAEVLSNQ